MVDRHQRRLVSNESSDIVRMLNSFQVRSLARLRVPPTLLNPTEAVHSVYLNVTALYSATPLPYAATIC